MKKWVVGTIGALVVVGAGVYSWAAYKQGQAFDQLANQLPQPYQDVLAYQQTGQGLFSRDFNLVLKDNGSPVLLKGHASFGLKTVVSLNTNTELLSLLFGEPVQANQWNDELVIERPIWGDVDKISWTLQPFELMGRRHLTCQFDKVYFELTGLQDAQTKASLDLPKVTCKRDSEVATLSHAKMQGVFEANAHTITSSAQLESSQFSFKEGTLKLVSKPVVGQKDDRGHDVWSETIEQTVKGLDVNGEHFDEVNLDATATMSQAAYEALRSMYRVSFNVPQFAALSYEFARGQLKVDIKDLSVQRGQDRATIYGILQAKGDSYGHLVFNVPKALLSESDLKSSFFKNARPGKDNTLELEIDLKDDIYVNGQKVE